MGDKVADSKQQKALQALWNEGADSTNIMSSLGNLMGDSPVWHETKAQDWPTTARSKAWVQAAQKHGPCADWFDAQHHQATPADRQAARRQHLQDAEHENGVPAAAAGRAKAA